MTLLIIPRHLAPALTEHGLAEDRDFLVSEPVPDVEVRPETVARMARFANGGVIPNDPGDHGDSVPLFLNGGCRP
jgi:hypothetical protein